MKIDKDFFRKHHKDLRTGKMNFNDLVKLSGKSRQFIHTQFKKLHDGLSFREWLLKNKIVLPQPVIKKGTAIEDAVVNKYITLDDYKHIVDAYGDKSEAEKVKKALIRKLEILVLENLFDACQNNKDDVKLQGNALNLIRDYKMNEFAMGIYKESGFKFKVE